MPQTPAFAFVGLVRTLADSPATIQDRDFLATVLQRHGALSVEWRRQGALAAFASALTTLRCALELVNLLSAAAPGARVGIDVPVDTSDTDTAKAVAQALAHNAKVGEVLVSATARAAVRPAPGITLDVHGPVEMPPAPFPVAAFRARRTETEAMEARSCLCFDGFRLDPQRRTLHRDGAEVPLEPLTFDLLLLLASNTDRVIPRDEVFARLWGARTVSDSALSTQVKALRQALGDSGRTQHSIATVHGRGFRFLRPVEQAGDDAAQPVALSDRKRPMIAVLPFDNLSGDASGRVFADGIAEDILNALGKHRWIGVIARNPAFAFRNSPDGLEGIAGQLGATHVGTGSLRKAGERVRIQAEAVEIRTMRRFWSDSFDRDLAQIFEFQDEICGTIAARLATELGVAEQQKARKLPRVNRGAWELYHLGMAEFYRFTAESNRRAQEFLRMAVRADPEFAEPYARLAYAITLEMVYFEGRVSQARLDGALDLALQGLARDDRDPQGHFALGRVRLARQEYDLAIDALEHALDLNPHLAVSHCGLGDSLAYEGRIKESIRHFERAIALSPHDPFRWAFHSYRSLAHLFGDDAEAAATAASRAVQVPNAHYSAHANLLAALGHLGDIARITRARSALMRAKPDFTLEIAERRMFYLKSRRQRSRYLEGLAQAGIG